MYLRCWKFYGKREQSLVSLNKKFWWRCRSITICKNETIQNSESNIEKKRVYLIIYRLKCSKYLITNRKISNTLFVNGANIRNRIIELIVARWIISRDRYIWRISKFRRKMKIKIFFFLVAVLDKQQKIIITNIEIRFLISKIPKFKILKIQKIYIYVFLSL